MIYNEDLTFKSVSDQQIYDAMVNEALPIIEKYIKKHFSHTEAELWITQRMLEGDIDLLVSDIYMEMQYNR